MASKNDWKILPKTKNKGIIPKLLGGTNKIGKVALNIVRTVKRIFTIIKIILASKFLTIGIVIAIILFLACSNLIVNEGEGDTGFLSTAIATRNYGSSVSTTKSLEKFIEEYNNGSDELKAKLLEEKNSIKKWKEDYGYSEYVFVTIAFEEEISAENFDNFVQKMNSTGEICKENSYTTIQEIATVYVGDETATEWANNIENSIEKNKGET